MAIVLLAAAVGACATTAGPPAAKAPVSVATPEPAPVPKPVPAPPPDAAPSAPAAPVLSSGVGYLVASAERQSASGQYEQAAASLERALRIEPKNALLWHRLARVRFEQGRWPLAVQLAAKSNQLAGTDRVLRSANYRLLAEAYAALGQWQKADEARRLADKP